MKCDNCDRKGKCSKREQEQKDHDEAVKAYQDAEEEMHKKDAAVLTQIKRQVSGEMFQTIETELEDSENHCNYKIVDTPTGTTQEEAGSHTLWINQSCGETGDNYSGTICMELPDGTFFKWSYRM